MPNINIEFNDFDRICRFCLNFEMKVPIFPDAAENSTNAIDNRKSLVDVIQICLGLKVFQSDGYPRFLCSDCLNKLKASYNFRQQCEESSRMLETARARHEQNILPENASKPDKNNFPEDYGRLTDETLDSPEPSKQSTSKKCIGRPKVSKIPEENKKKVPEKDNRRGICPVCGTFQGYMRQHMLIHSGERRFECTYCKKRFLQSGCLKTHLNIHTGHKPFKCDLCEKCFSDGSGLRLHKMSHSEDRNYTCETCQKKFRYIHNLAQHRRTHTQERKHLCGFCKRGFLTSSALKKHVMLHTGERNHKCDICKKGFITGYNLNMHKRIHFNNDIIIK